MVKIEGVNQFYGKRQVLRDVSLDVERGEVFGFLGPNGAGKSTLLKAVVGLLFPSEGRITLDGIDLQRERRRALGRIGFVPQRVAFPRHLTVQDVLEFHAALKGVGPDAVARSLARVRLEHARARLVGELSGGTLQRLGIAQAILADPPLLVFDEPTVGLDPQVSSEFRELVKELNREGATVMLTSHLLGEVELQADRVAILKEGSIIAKGSVPQLLASSGLPSSLWIKTPQNLGRVQPFLQRRGYLCEEAGAELRIAVTAEKTLTVLDMLREEGIEISAFRTTTPSLEEVFRSVVDRSIDETSCDSTGSTGNHRVYQGPRADPLGIGYVRPVSHDLG